MIRYAITDLRSLPGDSSAQIGALLKLAERWASEDIDIVQLREKQLPAGVLLSLTRRLLVALGPRTRLLVNGRADVALAAGAAGVHLTAHPDELTPEHVRQVFALAGAAPPLISVSCHSGPDVTRARTSGADLILFGPMFGKRIASKVVAPGLGLDALRQARLAAEDLQLLALGGITWQNAPQCCQAGADGVAGIRLFAEPVADPAS